MTREQAKERLPIIQAFAEGKTIQSKVCNGTVWVDIEKGDQANFGTELLDFRIKPEAKYRPFNSKEECWQEMQRHQPFGWIIYDDTYHSICEVDSGGITIIWECNPSFLDFKACLEEATFADGTPFGIQEEE